MLRPVAKEPQEDHPGGHDDNGAPTFGEAVPFPGTDRQEETPAYFDPAPPATVGQLLLATRRKYGQDLRQVSQSLRIRHSYLEAIEADRHGDLPGLAYAVGFVRSYADYLGLDSKAMVLRYKEEAQGLNRKTQLVFPSPVQEAKVPTGAIILIALVLLGLAYGGWTYFSREGEPPPLSVASPPAGQQPAEPQPATPQPNATAAAPATLGGGPAVGDAPMAGTSSAGSPTVAGAPDSSLGGPIATPLDEPGTLAPAETATTQDGSLPAGDAVPAAVSGSNGEAQAAEAPAAATVAAEPAAAEEPSAAVPGVTPPPSIPAAPAAPETTQEAAVPPLDPDAPRIVLQAKQDSWVQIRNAKDEAILTQVLREGESYAVPNEPGLVLLTGNAGGLVVELDGKALPPLGAVGAVKRNIVLDPVSLGAN